MQIVKIKDLELIHISIVLIIVIVLVFMVYQYSSMIPKKIDISIEAEEALEDEVNIESITKNKKSIICKIDEKYFAEEKYNNYVLGEGTGVKIDCSILLKIDNQYYKIRTFYKSVEDGKIQFVGYVNKKYLSKDYDILLYNNENSKIYRYVGDINEK